MSFGPDPAVGAARVARLHRWLRAGLIGGLTLLAAVVLAGIVRDPPDVAISIVIGAAVASVALIYLMGFLRYFPEAIGGSPASSHGDEDQRWRGFLRVACGAFLALQATFVGSAVIDSGDLRECLVGCAFAAVWMFATLIMFAILRRALGSASPKTVAERRHASPVDRVAWWLSPGASLRWGGLLALLSLIATISKDFGCPSTSHRGHEIVRRRAAWITAEGLDTSGWSRIVAEIDWAMYLMGLALALTALILVFRTRPPRSDARWLTWLGGASGIVALCTVSDLSFFLLRGLDGGQPYVLAAWLLTWLVPPVLWMRHVGSRTPGSHDRWRRLRTRLVILWLPVAGFAYMFVAPLASEAYGYSVYVLAVQLLWWGFVGLSGPREDPSSAGATRTGPGLSSDEPAFRHTLAGRPSSMRILRSAIGALFVLVLLGAAVGGWHFSTLVIEPKTERPLETLAVTSVDDSLIVLTGARIGRTGHTWFLEWPGGSGVTGRVAALARGSVSRRFQRSQGRLAPGDGVELRAYPYSGDPRRTCGLPFEDVQVTTGLGTFPAWSVSGPDSTWVVFVHGKAASRAEALRLLPVVHALGLPSLTISYRNDPGAPRGSDGLYHLGATEWEDLEAGVRHVLGRGARRVVLAGFSMGGAVIAEFLRHSALADSVAGVVLDAPVLDWSAVVARGAEIEGGVAPLLAPVAMAIVSLRTGFRWADSGQPAWSRQFRTQVPILLFHGTADETVPIGTSEAFSKAMGKRVTFVKTEGAGHVCSWNEDPERYELALRRWLTTVARDTL